MILILMGVSGSGKSTIGKMLAAELGWEFHDGDDFHPERNIAKMKSGTPLNDDDRRPWLETIQQFMQTCLNENRSVIIACSALKESYRQLLLSGNPEVLFVHLKGSKELIARRMQERTGHFMKPGLLDSQFATLEEPSDALAFDISQSPEAIVQGIKSRLNR